MVFDVHSPRERGMLESEIAVCVVCVVCVVCSETDGRRDAERRVTRAVWREVERRRDLIGRDREAVCVVCSEPPWRAARYRAACQAGWWRGVM
jgi:hypothetical protein